MYLQGAPMPDKSLSRVQLFVTPWTVAHQVPPSMGFSRQEYWSWVAMPSFRGSSQPRNRAGISYISCTRRWVILPLVPPGKGPIIKDNFSPERLTCRAGQPLFTKHFLHSPSLELNFFSPQYLSFVFSWRWYFAGHLDNYSAFWHISQVYTDAKFYCLLKFPGDPRVGLPWWLRG